LNFARISPGFSVGKSPGFRPVLIKNRPENPARIAYKKYLAALLL
jgi:hypothetical protein